MIDFQAFLAVGSVDSNTFGNKITYGYKMAASYQGDKITITSKLFLLSKII